MCTGMSVCGVYVHFLSYRSLPLFAMLSSIYSSRISFRVSRTPYQYNFQRATLSIRYEYDFKLFDLYLFYRPIIVYWYIFFLDIFIIRWSKMHGRAHRQINWYIPDVCSTYKHTAASEWVFVYDITISVVCKRIFLFLSLCSIQKSMGNKCR